MYKAYRFRFYPTKEQANILAQTFGCVRYVYNRTLAERTQNWYENKQSTSYLQTSKNLTAMKKDTDSPWLTEVSSVALQQSLRHQQVAFTNFFAKRAKYPTFKKRSNTQSAEYTVSGYKYVNGQITLAKMKQPLKIRWSQTLPKGIKPATVTVTKDASHRYHISILVDDPTIQPLPETDSNVGLDLGIGSLVTLSTGEKIVNIKSLKRYRQKLRRLQQNVSRKKKGSENRKKAVLKLAKCHAKIADTRKDYMHKTTSRIINENQVICIEDLNVNGMMKNHGLAGALSDASFGEFKRQLEYKAKWCGRTVVKVDRWFPSSKRCSDCGCVVSKLPLNIRSWVCVSCGVMHDRDVNAAKNILAAGLAVLVCGDDVIPKQVIVDVVVCEAETSKDV
jgi:putative transposase